MTKQHIAEAVVGNVTFGSLVALGPILVWVEQTDLCWCRVRCDRGVRQLKSFRWTREYLRITHRWQLDKTLISDFSEGSQIRTPISYFKAKCHLDRRPLPKQSYQKLILQISVLLLPEEDCSTVLDLPSLTSLTKRKESHQVGRSSVDNTIPSPLILFLLLCVFSSYSFSPLIRFLLLFFFSLFFSSPLTSLHLIVLNMFLLSSFKLRVSHCLLCLVSFCFANHYKLPWLTTLKKGKWLKEATDNF